MTNTPQTIQTIILNVRRANLALARIDHWQRVAVDALNAKPFPQTNLAARAESHLIRARRDLRTAQAGMRFPWETAPHSGGQK